jgi:hypothetical protein
MQIWQDDRQGWRAQLIAPRAPRSLGLESPAEDERRASVDNTCVQGVGVRGTEASTVNGAWIIRDLVLNILTGKIWLAVGSHGRETRTGDQLSAPGDRMEAGIGWSLEMVAWQDLRFGRRHL